MLDHGRLVAPKFGLRFAPMVVVLTVIAGTRQRTLVDFSESTWINHKGIAGTDALHLP